jgi:hypothetical protein
MLHRAIIFVLGKEHFSFVMLIKQVVAAGAGPGQANAT